MTVSIDHLHNLDKRFSLGDDELVPINLWVPSERVAVHRIAKPTAPQRKWSSLVPWVLEERLLQPVDKMHFVIGTSPNEDLVDVFTVSREDLNTWLSVADNSGFLPVKMVPDYFAIPWEEGRINVGWRDGFCLVRHSATEGFAAKPDLAWTMIECLLDDDMVALRLSISLPDPKLVPENLRVRAEVNDAVPDWQMTDMEMTVNLLSGEFAPPRQAPRLNLGQANLAGFVIVTLLLLTYLNNASHRISTELENIEGHLTSNFGRVFMGQEIVPSQLKEIGLREISRLRAQSLSLNSDPLRALTVLGRLLVACECDLRVLEADEREITLHVDAGEKLLTRNVRIDGYSLDIERVNENSDEVILVLRPGGAS